VSVGLVLGLRDLPELIFTIAGGPRARPRVFNFITWSRRHEVKVSATVSEGLRGSEPTGDEGEQASIQKFTLSEVSTNL